MLLPELDPANALRSRRLVVGTGAASIFGATLENFPAGDYDSAASFLYDATQHHQIRPIMRSLLCVMTSATVRRGGEPAT